MALLIAVAILDCLLVPWAISYIRGPYRPRVASVKLIWATTAFVMVVAFAFSLTSAPVPLIRNMLAVLAGGALVTVINYREAESADRAAEYLERRFEANPEMREKFLAHPILGRLYRGRRNRDK